MPHKAGFVNLIGRPNVGKSTLLNALVGEELAIVTPKAQTTRQRIIGIVNDESYQVVFSDTPGMLEPKYALQANMMSTVKEALQDADILLLVLDVADEKPDFFGFEKAFGAMNIPFLIALNKVDLSNQESLEQAIARVTVKFPTAEIIPVSALHDFGVSQLKNRIVELLPEAEAFYEKDALTDKPMRFFAAEIIRERVLENYQKEIPYSVQVEIEHYKEEEKLLRIGAVIFVARKSQKGIVIGHKGQKLKIVGTEARKKIEKFTGSKVFLELYVKVDEDWRNNEKRLKAYGYKS